MDHNFGPQRQNGFKVLGGQRFGGGYWPGMNACCTVDQNTVVEPLTANLYPAVSVGLDRMVGCVVGVQLHGGFGL